MNNKLLKKEEIKKNVGIDFKIRKDLKLSIILGGKQEEVKEQYIGCIKNESTIENLLLRGNKEIAVNLLKKSEKSSLDDLKKDETIDMDNQIEENYKNFYDLLDKQVKDLWNEIFDRAIELDIECKKYNKEAKLLLNYEYISVTELQSFLTSEDIDFIEKIDDDTYEVLIDEEVFSIKFI